MAITMPIPCQRVTRSRNTTIANTTVPAGYSEIKMLAKEQPRPYRQPRGHVGADVQQGYGQCQLQRLPARQSQVTAHRSQDEHHNGGRKPGETTEIGPDPRAAKNAHMPNTWLMPYKQPHTTAPD